MSIGEEIPVAQSRGVGMEERSIYQRVYDAPVGGQASDLRFNEDGAYFIFVTDEGDAFKISVEKL